MDDEDSTLDMLLRGFGESPASDATSSASESSAPAPVAKQSPPTKKRKATYYVRKDAIELLQDQVLALQTELTRVQRVNKSELRDAQTLANAYAVEIERNNLALAGTEAMLSAYKTSMGANATVPLATHIHLLADAAERDAVMKSLYEPKLAAALRFMVERTQSLDLSQPHKQAEHSQLVNVELIFSGFDVTPFTTGHSVRQVYDALMFFVTNQEISISERLGVLTIRENDEFENFQYGQSRFLSTVPGGVEMESNAAMFAKFVEHNTDGDTHPAYAIAAMDFVDQDDLHPFRIDCGRKEMTTALLLAEIPTPTGRVVALCKWGYTRFRAPAASMTEKQIAAVRDTMVSLSDIMPRIMRERLAAQEPDP